MTMTGGGPVTMDPLLVMLGSLLCTLSGLIFVEVRRIRKRLDQRASQASAVTSASSASG